MFSLVNLKPSWSKIVDPEEDQEKHERGNQKLSERKKSQQGPSKK